MNMYLEFTTKQLKEFEKLIAILESCTNPDQHMIATNILNNWGHMCDHRSKRLKKAGLIGMCKLQFKPYKEYKRYIVATGEQVQYLIDYSNMWLDQYKEWEKEQESASKDKDRIYVTGFSKLLKKKKK